MGVFQSPSRRIARLRTVIRFLLFWLPVSILGAQSPRVSPLPLPDNAALPMRIAWEEEVVDGYRSAQVRLHGSTFDIWANANADWTWKPEDSRTVVVRHRLRPELAFGIRVYPTLAFAVDPTTPAGMRGYLKWLRGNWERDEGRRFESRENTLLTDGPESVSTGPMIFGPDGRPLGRVESSVAPEICGHDFQRISYLFVSVNAAGEEKREQHTEWWVEAGALRARIHLMSEPGSHARFQVVVARYLEDMALLPFVAAEPSEPSGGTLP